MGVSTPPEPACGVVPHSGALDIYIAPPPLEAWGAFDDVESRPHNSAALPASRALCHGAVPGGDSPACAMRLDTSTSDHASSAPSRAYTSATVAWTACAQSCEGERFAAPRQTVSRRFRAPAFAGGTTGSGGTRNALGSAPGALQRPPRHLRHLRPLCCSVTPTSEIHPFLFFFLKERVRAQGW